jgi:hypothetical protein
MKKMYMKPLATNVAFVVNENIATSLPKQPDEGLTSAVEFQLVTPNICKSKFYGYDTGLTDKDEADIFAALEYIGANYGREAYMDVLNKYLNGIK